MMKPHKCPVCGQYEFKCRSSFDICRVCGWQDDGYQEDFPDEELCGNNMSLNQYREFYATNGRPEWLDDIFSDKE